MSTVSYPPIFCEECASLALATLDSVPLCANCLRRALQASADPVANHNIEPLDFECQEQCCIGDAHISDLDFS